MFKKIFNIVVITFLLFPYEVMACTNLIVGKKASADGSVMCTYNADSYGAFFNLYHSPAATHQHGEMIKIFDWDTNEFHGEIHQVAETYNVIGNINEYQLTIGETTYGGREEMVDTTGIMDYGSLIYITLQRAKTAREAIRVMTSLVEKYGYCSEGETFTLCDPNEAWIMEMQGAGAHGVVWVAVRIPDNAICAHANQSRITKFPQARKLNKKLNCYEVPGVCLYSANCIRYAREKGWYSENDEDFSWNAAYAAPDFGGRRFCDARVWAFFRHFSDGMDKYLPWAEGFDKNAEPLPLWVIPNRKLSLHDVKMSMRDHYEDTPLAVDNTIGGGLWEMPYQLTPLSYEVDGESYFTERPISTQQTGFTFVSQMRSWLPRQIGGVLWFGNDDANMVAYTPIYCGNNVQPECYNTPDADATTFSQRNAFWMCNFVSNMVYPRYSVLFPELKIVRDSLENSYALLQQEIEKRALSLYNQSDGEAVKYLTDYSAQKAEEMMDTWKSLALLIIVRHNDMAVKQMKDGRYLMTKDGIPVPVKRPGYPARYAKRMIQMSSKCMKKPHE